MLYDLTHAITAHMPVYPGDPQPRILLQATIAHEGYAVSELTFGSHTGTHIDAPEHMIDGGKRLADYPLERFVIPAICIDVRQGFDVDILGDTLDQPGQGVLFYTGASDYFHEDRYWHDYPTIPVEIQKMLIACSVSMVGIDAGNFDTADDFPVHKRLLCADILLLENLTNFAQLVGKQFELIALPLKILDDGAPTRVIARTFDQ